MQYCRNSKFILLFAFILLATSTASAQFDALLKPGTKAPVNSLKATDDKTYQFPEAGQWNMVFYWSMFCHSCLDEIPALQKYLADKDTVTPFFVALDTKKMKTAIKNYCQKRNIKHPILLEEIASQTYRTADQWGVMVTPSVFVVSPEGIIKYSHAGPMDLEKFFKEFAQMQQKATGSKTLKPCPEE